MAERILPWILIQKLITYYYNYDCWASEEALFQYGDHEILLSDKTIILKYLFSYKIYKASATLPESNPKHRKTIFF